MRLVINRCFGGFSLSDKGMKEYARIKCINLYPDNDWLPTYWLTPEGSWDAKSQFLSIRDFDRSDPILIEVVERLGEESWGSCAKLAVIEIPDGIEWEISEYDGMEEVEEKHRSWS